MKIFRAASFILCLTTLVLGCVYDKKSPAQRKAENAISLQLHVCRDALEVILGFTELFEMLALSATSTAMRQLVAPHLLTRFCRVNKSAEKIVPDLSKIMFAAAEPGADSRMLQLSSRFYDQYMANEVLVDPETLACIAMSQNRSISIVPYAMSHVKADDRVRKAVMLRLMTFGRHAEDLVVRLATKSCLDEEVIWRGIENFRTFELIYHLIRIKDDIETRPQLKDQDNAYIIAYQLNEGQYGHDVSTLYDNIVGLKAIPGELLRVLLKNDFVGMVLSVCSVRKDIVIDSSPFWIQLLNAPETYQLRICECLQERNPIAAGLILEPSSIIALLDNPISASLLPFVAAINAKKKWHPGHFLRYSNRALIKDPQVFIAAFNAGAHKSIVDGLGASLQITSHEQAVQLLECSMNMDGGDGCRGRWLQGTSVLVLRSMIGSAKTQGITKVCEVVALICRFHAHHTPQILMVLDQTWEIKECRSLLTSTILHHLQSTKGELEERRATLYPISDYIVKYSPSPKEKHQVIVRDLTNILMQSFTEVATLIEFFTLYIHDRKYLVLLPVIFSHTLCKQHFEFLAKTYWSKWDMEKAKVCVDFRVKPNRMLSIIKNLSKKHELYELVFYAFERHPDLVTYISKLITCTHNFRIVLDYLERSNDVSAFNVMKLLRAFKFHNEDPKALIHACIQKKIPEVILQYIMRCYGLAYNRMKLDASLVYSAALNEEYSDELMMMLISVTDFRHYSPKLLSMVCEGVIERSGEFKHALKDLADQSRPIIKRISGSIKTHKK